MVKGGPSIAQRGSRAFGWYRPGMVGGAGHFVGTGTIKDASSSGEMGAEKGGAAAFLGRFGLSGPMTRQYQNKLAEGGILIAVQVGKQKTATVARKIFEDARCQEISEGRFTVHRSAFGGPKVEVQHSKSGGR
jgi:hypothetical protein